MRAPRGAASLESLDPTTGHVLAEIPGTDLKDEIVMIGVGSAPGAFSFDGLLAGLERKTRALAHAS